MQFATPDGERRYGRAFADLIRAERHDLAEDRLTSDLATLRVPLAELCLETRADAVELTDWETLGQLIFQPLRDGGLCSAIGLDLSNYADLPPTPEGWVELSVEVPFYSDSAFPFSTATREEILAVNASDPTPWQGRFEDVGPFGMLTVGLARLNSAIEGHSTRRHLPPGPGQPPAPAPAEFVAYRLATWFRALRFHQTAKRYLDHEGLARRIPVIVGSHGAGPFLEAVYYPAPSRESAAAATARMQAAVDARREAWRAEQRRALQERADSMREMRKAIRATRFWPSPRARRLREYYEATEASLIRRSQPLGPVPRPSWQIADDAEFERFLQRYYIDPFLR